jgi:anti-sigma factor RsiW
VIARLDGYVAGSLAEEERVAVVAHVSGCPLCEDFGGRYAKTIASIRRIGEALDTHDEAASKARVLGRLDRLR